MLFNDSNISLSRAHAREKIVYQSLESCHDRDRGMEIHPADKRAGAARLYGIMRHNLMRRYV